MKNKIILLVVFLFFAACVKQENITEKTGPKPNKIEPQNKTDQPMVINVYYFHGNFRCPTCRNMENYSREAVDTYFKKEIESGKINFRAINVEEDANRHYVKDYELYTKALILSVTKRGKEVKYKNLTKIWEYSRNKEKFFDYVKNEVGEYLRTE